MKAYDKILDHIESLRIVDTHEHLYTQDRMPKEADVLSEWLLHYFSCDLVSAGLSDAGMAMARDPKQDLLKRWAVVEPYWKAASNTGYARSLAITARDLFGIDDINGKTIEALNAKVMSARARKDYYSWVLQEKSRIAVSIRDTLPIDTLDVDVPEAFVFTMRSDQFIMPANGDLMHEIGRSVGVEVNSLEDWCEVTHRYFDKNFSSGSRVVCLKCGLAYVRTLQFDLATREDAERDFKALISSGAPVEACRVFQNYMQHFICRMADERSVPYQIHTGIQEGNGNVLMNSHPLHLTNLFMAYPNITFDIFHMGYPFVMEAGVLAKNFRNVNLDMCWAHIISPVASQRTLMEWLDLVPANKICAFGGDYVFVEAVYGHQYMARRNVAEVLTRKVKEGSFGLDDAKEIARWLFIDNPKRIFGLDRFPPYFK